jgi:hypothetical protein
MNTPDSAENQLRLIEAAVLSGTVKRFSPSEFALDYLSASAAYVLASPFHSRSIRLPLSVAYC